MAEELERKRPEVHWKDLVLLCHATHGSDTTWNVLGYPVYRIDAHEPLRRKFHLAIDQNISDPECFDLLLKGIEEVRSNQFTCQWKLLKNCMSKRQVPGKGVFDPDKWGDISVQEFTRQARESWMKEMSPVGHYALISRTIEAIEKLDDVNRKKFREIHYLLCRLNESGRV
jgi:hypothetical protein